MSLHLEDDQMCFACGKKNKAGFKLNFSHPKKGQLFSEVVFQKKHQGYKNIVHGGLVATVLDEMMVNLIWLDGIAAVTVELTVRLKKAVPVGQKVLLEGVFEKGEGRLLHMKAFARDAKGVLYASAEAKCLRMPDGPITLAGRPKAR